MHFDLRRIDSDAIPLVKPTLEVGPERVAMVRRIAGLPPWRGKQLPRRQLASARVLAAEKIAGLKGLSYITQQSVASESKDPRDQFLLLLFDVDGDQQAWVLKGPDDELLRAEHALLMPGAKLAEAAELEERSSDPVVPQQIQDPGTHGLMRALVGAGVVCTLLGFVFLLFGRGGDDGGRIVIPVDAQAQVIPAEAENGQAQPPPGSPDPSATAIPSTPIQVNPASASPFAAGQLSAAAAALTRQLNLRPRVYRIVAGERSATFEIYTPGRRDILQSWDFQGGTLTGPNPVVSAPFEGGEFFFNDVRLGRVPGVVSRAKRIINAGQPAQENATVVIRRNVPNSRRLRMRVDVTGPRSADAPPIFASPGGKIL